MSEALWSRYSASWSMTGEDRLARLLETVSPDVTYTDPNITLTGIPSFSDYMSGFQTNLPGASFMIRSVMDHHQRSLSHWDMLDADKAVIGTGASFAEVGNDGKFAHITGFFDAA